MSIETKVKPHVEELIKAIQDKRFRQLSTKIVRYPRKNPILSDISECDRQMVYGVLNWEDRELYNEDLQARFDEGKMQEKKVMSELQDLGFDVILSQQPVVVKGSSNEILATGKIDGFILFQGGRFPIEVKSMNPNEFNKVYTAEDLQKKAYMRKYVRQIQMYMYGNNEEMGLFLMTDCMGHWKLLPVFLDYGECELILQRLEKVYKAIQAKQYPERIPYSKEMCGRCPFAQVCLPDILNEGLEFIDNDQMEQILNEREKLSDSVDRYEELDKQAKELAKNYGKDFIVNSSYKVEVKNIKTTRLDTDAIPVEIRSKYKIESEQTRVKFIPLNKEK